MEKISKPNFSMMKKYFSSDFFSNIKSLISAFQRHQLELLGVSESETARETKKSELECLEMTRIKQKIGSAGSWR